jgi:hypothetical protein
MSWARGKGGNEGNGIERKIHSNGIERGNQRPNF